MPKLITLFKRMPGVDRQAFLDYCRGDRTSLVKRLPGVRRWQDNIPVDVPGREPLIDFVVEAWWDDLDQLRAAFESAAWSALEASQESFVDPGRTLSGITSERIILDPPAGGAYVKYFAVLYRRPDVSFEYFSNYWWETHSKVVVQNVGPRGYIQCPAMQIPGLVQGFDGVAIAWLDARAEARGPSDSPQMKTIRADERNFLDQSRLCGVITTA